MSKKVYKLQMLSVIAGCPEQAEQFDIWMAEIAESFLTLDPPKKKCRKTKIVKSRNCITIN